jgi:hypothetical protein
MGDHRAGTAGLKRLAGVSARPFNGATSLRIAAFFGPHDRRGAPFSIEAGNARFCAKRSACTIRGISSDFISLMSCNLGYSFRFEQFADTFFYRLTFPQIFHDSLRALNL